MVVGKGAGKGIQVSCVISIKSLKLPHVGFLTKNLGGYASISFILFGAVMQISTSFAVGYECMNLTGFPSTDYATHTMVPEKI